MNLRELAEKWRKLVADCNRLGLPIPVLKEPKSQEGSVSLTLVFISFNLCVAGIIGKWSGSLGGVDVNSAFNLFIACAGLYWGRRIGRNANGQAELDEKVDSKKES